MIGPVFIPIPVHVSTPRTDLGAFGQFLVYALAGVWMVWFGARELIRDPYCRRDWFPYVAIGLGLVLAGFCGVAVFITAARMGWL